MQREIRLTADGSHTVAIPEMNETYHSHFGAMGESMHVYMNAGLQPFLHQPSNKQLTVFYHPKIHNVLSTLFLIML